MKIAISSDNHIDVNRQDPEHVMAFQTAWLNDHQVDYYLFAGDLFNNFQKSADFMADFQRHLTNTKVFYIAGNHDMLGAKSDQEIENLASDQYLHNRYLDLPGTQWRIVGNNGWYDYSFSTYQDQAERVARWKKVYWLDSAIPQPLSDPAKMQRVLEQTDGQLAQARAHHKEVLLLTHFAPRHQLLAPKPSAVNTPRRERFYQMINAMMGSDRYGQLLEESGVVKAVFYGHLHAIHHAFQSHGVTYLHQAVGVHNKRHNEWQQPTFQQQWLATLRLVDDSTLNVLDQ